MGTTNSHHTPFPPKANESENGGVPTRQRSRQALLKKLTRGKVVFLGLDGAGKSTLLHHVLKYTDENEKEAAQSTASSMESAADPPPNQAEPATNEKQPHPPSSSNNSSNNNHSNASFSPDPTKSPQISTFQINPEMYVQLIDLPGRKDFRPRWYTTLVPELTSNPATSHPNQRQLPIAAIVFVIDASDRVRFPIVAEELVRLQHVKEHHSKLQHVPFVILLNKTDQSLARYRHTMPSPSYDTEAKHLIRHAMREVRRELKTSVDHELRMDQRRRPHAHQQKDASDTLVDPALDTTTPRASKAVVAAAAKKAEAAEANQKRNVGLMTSILECSALDRDSIKAIRTWLQDEVKKGLAQ